LAELRKIWDKYTQGWIGSIIYLVLGFLIAYFFNMALGFALGTETPVVAVFSESMIPTLQRGDMIIVYGDRDVSVGDIIVFDVSNRKYPIIHRIYNITEDEIITKGDHNQYTDNWSPPITKDNLYGKAVLKIPLLGWVKIIFTDITGL